METTTSVRTHIIIAKGFITDGASCPNALASICTPMSGHHAEAAVLHDYLYSLDCPLGYDREMADRMFLEGMLSDGTNWMRANTIYSGVRLGGGSSFRKMYSKEKRG